MVDLSGWWLTDDPAVLQKFPIAAGTVIPAAGHVVILGDTDGDPANNAALPAPYFGRAFLLSSYGERLVLSSPDLAYSHAVDFGASDNSVSFGRHITSTGREVFPAQQSRTLGAANAGPRIGPVVISEIMYNPPTGGAEYLELTNLTDAPVALDGLGGPWQVHGIGFAFPPGTVLPARGQIILLRDTMTVAAFRAAYGLPITLPVLTYSGGIDNGGETLRLERPLDPDPITGETALVTVDGVDYDDDPPWPASADGAGHALHRVPLDAFGDDVASWRAGPSGPGSWPGRRIGVTAAPATGSEASLDDGLLPQALPAWWGGLAPSATHQVWFAPTSVGDG